MKKNLLNLISLTLIQAANALTPLVLFPFSLIAVGSDAYAVLATSEAAAIVISVLVIYGFEIGGPAKIARLPCSNNVNEISVIFSNILYARLIIYLIAFILFLPLVWIFLDKRSAVLFTLWLAVPLSIALQPNWLFQAMEKNIGFSIIVIASRIASLVIVLANVSDAEDVFLIPAIIGICYITGAIVSLLYLKFGIGIWLTRPHFREIWNFLVEGRHIFIGNLSVTLYRDLNVLILGAIGANTAAISIYSVAEKLVKGLQTVMRPLNQLFFPKALRALDGHYKPSPYSLRVLWSFLYPQLIVLTAIVFALAFVFVYIVPEGFKIRYGLNQSGINLIILIMVPSIFFGVANFMLGTTGLNFLNQQKYMMTSIMATGFGSIGVTSALSVTFGAIGTGVSFVIAEVFLFILVFIKYLKC